MSRLSDSPEIITRKQAQAEGLKRYFTGKPCRHGHVAERWVANRGCIECRTARVNDPSHCRRCLSPRVPDRTFCERHLAAHAKTNQAVRARYVAAGKCSNGCGRPLAPSSGWRCEECLQSDALATQDRYEYDQDYRFQQLLNASLRYYRRMRAVHAGRVAALNAAT